MGGEGEEVVDPGIRWSGAVSATAPFVFATAPANVEEGSRRREAAAAIPLSMGVEGGEGTGRKEPARRDSSPRRLRTSARSEAITSACWAKARALSLHRRSFPSRSFATSSVRKEIPSRALRSMRWRPAESSRSPKQGVLFCVRSGCDEGGNRWLSSPESMLGLPAASNAEHEHRPHWKGCSPVNKDCSSSSGS